MFITTYSRNSKRWRLLAEGDKQPTHIKPHGAHQYTF